MQIGIDSFVALSDPSLPAIQSPAEPKKIRRADRVLGGISRVSLQMNAAAVPQEKMLRAIELLGTQVSPLVQKSLAASPLH